MARVTKAPGRRGKPEVAQWYLEEGPTITSENNVVNTILVEFRAFDTLGELAVLGMAGIAMAAVVSSMPRWPQYPGRPGPLPQAGLNSLPLRKLVQWMTPLLFALSLIVLYRGGNEPGGGFNAALIGASALMLKYLSQPDDRPLMGRNIPYLFSGFGVIVAIGIGFVGYVDGSFLAPLHGTVAGQHLTTALIFDVGVYLAVLGLVMIAVNLLGVSGSPSTTPSGVDSGTRAEDAVEGTRERVDEAVEGELPGPLETTRGEELPDRRRVGVRTSHLTSGIRPKEVGRR